MSEQKPTIRELYPDFTEEELAVAENNLERYLALMMRIYDRLEPNGDRSEVDGA